MAICIFVPHMADKSNEQRKPGSNQSLENRRGTGNNQIQLSPSIIRQNLEIAHIGSELDIGKQDGYGMEEMINREEGRRGLNKNCIEKEEKKEQYLG